MHLHRISTTGRLCDLPQPHQWSTSCRRAFWQCRAHAEDIYILRPCHGNANSSRSNDPFGEVNDSQAQWYGVNGNTYTSTSNQPSGSNNWSEGSGSTWEPRESKREMWPARCSTTTPCIRTRAPTSRQGNLATLYDWHENDPPDAAEISRNTKVIKSATKTPYVAHPELCTSRGCMMEPAQRRHGRTGLHRIAPECQCGVWKRAGCAAEPTDPCGVESLTYEDTFQPWRMLWEAGFCGPTLPWTVVETPARLSNSSFLWMWKIRSSRLFLTT